MMNKSLYNYNKRFLYLKILHQVTLLINKIIKSAVKNISHIVTVKIKMVTLSQLKNM
jgi:hypothetical protein